MGTSTGRSGSLSRPRPPPKLSDIPRQSEGNRKSALEEEEPESIFSTLGRTVNQYLGVENDDNTTKNTTGSAKYTNAPVKARKNANDAERRANEMVDAMAWLNNPETAAVEATTAIDNNSGSDNWWEKEDDPSSGIGDDISIF